MDGLLVSFVLQTIYGSGMTGGRNSWILRAFYALKDDTLFFVMFVAAGDAVRRSRGTRDERKRTSITDIQSMDPRVKPEDDRMENGS